jgi:putative nucleotidyltransferase with HDIG domain
MSICTERTVQKAQLTMNRVSIIADSVERATQISTHLSGVFETQIISVSDLPRSNPSEFIIGDVTMSQSKVAILKAWIERRPKNGHVIFVVDKESRPQAVQAYAVGATDVLPRPINRKMLLAKLLGDLEALAGSPSDQSFDSSCGISKGLGALQNIFAAAALGSSLDTKSIDLAGQSIVSQIEDEGCVNWIETVRKHHSQTYQHCLIVTGVAVTFGRYLGFSNADQQRLATAGLLHDLGKARIPLSILEKPGPLDTDELATMRQHPLLGYDVLRTMKGVQPEMLDMVTHHHECLDGSGYPHGLQGSELSDLVRTMTIADVFGALIERRSYKPPLSGEAAFQVLSDMGPKLDRDLVKAFRPLSKTQFG